MYKRQVYYWSKFQAWGPYQSRYLEGGGICPPPIPTVEVSEVALRRVKTIYKLTHSKTHRDMNTNIEIETHRQPNILIKTGPDIQTIFICVCVTQISQSTHGNSARCSFNVVKQKRSSSNLLSAHKHFRLHGFPGLIPRPSALGIGPRPRPSRPRPSAKRLGPRFKNFGPRPKKTRPKKLRP